MSLPLTVELRLEAAAEDARDGHDYPDEVADYEAERCAAERWRGEL